MGNPAKIKWRAFARQAVIFAFLFGVGFGIIGLIEHRFAVWQINDGETSDLNETVGDVSNNLVHNGHWNIALYRQWENETPSNYLILEDTGQLIDIKGDPADFLVSTLPVDQYIPQHPTFIHTDLGETWLIQNKRVADENVVGGIDAADLIGLKEPQYLLARELAKFGTTTKSVNATDPTALRNFTTGFMTVKDSGKVASVWGGVPLRVRTAIPDQFLNGNIQDLRRDGETYSLLSRRISVGNHSALIIAFDDMDTSAIDQSLRFNLQVAGGSWLVAFLGYLVLAIRNRLRQSQRDSSLEISTRQLIAQGENAPLEFKSTLRRNLHTNKNDSNIELMVLRTIAAFLNTDGGILLIGVADDGTICGLAADEFANRDKAVLHLTSLIDSRLGSSHNTFVTKSVEDMGDGLEVMRVECKRGAMPAYVRTDKGEAFFVRTGPATKELQLSEVHSYIRTRFENAE